MTDRKDVLNLYLSDLRRSAKLSVEQVCLRTKIQARFVDAIEAGHFGELPSNTHLRAFCLALAKASGGDEAHTAALVRGQLAASAPLATEAEERGFDTPAPAPGLSVQTPPKAGGFVSSEAVFAGAAAGPSAGGGGNLASASLVAASARLRSLPLSVLLTLLALAGTLSYGAAWSVEHWRQHQISQLLGSTAAESAPAAPLAGAPPQPAAVHAQSKTLPAAPAGYAAVQAPQASGAAGPVMQLTLRARRACWLVLEIDGKRLPTVTMQDGDKLNWNVSQRAVMLAGNLGALRVWWLGDNQGYLGDLDTRANAVVFERGRLPRIDPSAALPLPAGIPQ
ncbi:MAG TPA: RodZ domain-containing protein [bacterium]|jgi:hypothetical protein|nr:RodZ domain-containing protein [bacterium]